MSQPDILVFLSNVRPASEGWRAKCPMCNAPGTTLWVNPDKTWAMCHHSGSSCHWSKELGGASLSRILSFFNVHGVPENIPETLQQSETADVKLPDEFELISDLEHSLKRDLLSYFESRGIHRKIVERAKVGYCRKGKLWGYIIFPIFENGEVVLWQARRYKDREPKFYNPKSSRKGDLIYRIRRHSSKIHPRKIILVESIFNAMTLEPFDARGSSDMVIALLGKTLSDKQLDVLLHYERWCREVVITLDPDAIHEAVDIAARLEPLIPCVRVSRFPEGQDVNSVGRERAWRLIWTAPTYRDSNRMAFLHGESA